MADEIVEMVPMDKCGVFTGKSIEDAKRKAADDFQIPLKDIKFKVIEDVKKGFSVKLKLKLKFGQDIMSLTIWVPIIWT